MTVNDITTGATIYYTTNDTAPTTSSSSISAGGTIVLNLNTTLEVQAYLGSSNPSSVITATYTTNGLITSGSQHAIALTSNGTLWGSGNNSSGQLGIGSTTTASLPAQLTLTGANPIVGVTSSKALFDHGLPVEWEMQYFGQTGNDPNSSPNGNGLTLLQDYQQGNDPTNYYSQNGQIVTPTISIVSGTPQTSAVGTFAAQPMIVQVTNGTTGATLTDAPVTFTVNFAAFPVGQVASDPLLGTPSVILQTVTDINGKAQVYFQQPKYAGVVSQVSANTTAGQSVTFTAMTPVDNGPPAAPSNLSVTPDGSGELDLSWTNNADNATSTLIQESTDGVNWTTIATLTNPYATSYAVTGLAPGGSYYFKEIAANNNGTNNTQETAEDDSDDPAVNPNANTTDALPPPRYAAVDLGPNLDPVKITSPSSAGGSTFIWMKTAGTTTPYYLWQDGVLSSALQPAISGDSFSVADIGSDGTMIGTEGHTYTLGGTNPHQQFEATMAIWSASSTTPSMTMMPSNTITYPPPPQGGDGLTVVYPGTWAGVGISAGSSGETIFSMRAYPFNGGGASSLSPSHQRT